MKEAVVVSFEENDLTVQALYQVVCVAVSGFPDQVSEDIYEIALVHLCIPAAHKLCVHLLNGGKWSVIEAKHIFMPKVQIACKEYLLQNRRLLYPFSFSFLPMLFRSIVS